MILEPASIFLEENSIKNRLLLYTKILTKIRGFFAKRGIIEVTTPLLCSATNPAPYLNNFYCDNLYLQTSPEFAMKKLLAAGSGDIYQICKAFRKDELGRLHNPEFTILEWYRTNFNHHKLMDEMDALLKHTIHTPKAERYTYQKIWEKFLKINPHKVTLKKLRQLAEKNDLLITSIDNNADTWLQLLFTHLIEPHLGKDRPTFIYDFPKSQAMLARTRYLPNKIQVASRFEVYYKGIELANGFHELNDPKEQHRRFSHDLKKRRKLNLPPIPLDYEFLEALTKLPNCSGVALGLDRLVLLAANVRSLDDVLCFR